MTEHYDSLETRDPAAREREQFARLPETIARAMTAPGWAKQLAGIDPKSVTSRAALAENEDVKEFYLGIAEGKRKSFRNVKHYKRRKRWLA